MATAVLLKKVAGIPSPQYSAETDQALLGGLALSAGGTAALYDDANVTALQIGGGAALTDIDIGSAANAPNVDIDGNAVEIDADAASHFTVDGAALTLATTTSGNVEIDGIDAVKIESEGAISIGDDDRDQDINIGTKGERSINVGTGAFAATITIGNTTGATALALKSGTGSTTITGDTVITGNLTVQGDSFVSEAETVLYDDNHLYLNNAYKTAVAETGGLIVNYLPTATTDTVAATGFVAGVGAGDNPKVYTVGNAFAATDLIQVDGAADPANNGLFEVLSHAGEVLTIKGIGSTATVEDFTQNQFVTDTTVQGTIFKVNVSVMRAGTDGTWESAKGNQTGFVFADLALATVDWADVLAQDENSGANSPSIDTGQKLVGAAELTLEAEGGSVRIDASDNTLLTNATALTADAALTVTATAADLALASSTKSVVITGAEAAADAVTITASNAAGGIDINAGVTSGVVTINGGGSCTITHAGINLAGGASEIDLTTSGALDLNSGAFTLEASTASLAMTSSFDLQAAGAVTIDSSAAAISIGADADAFAINVGTGAAARTITIGNATGATSVVLNAGTGNIDIGVGNQVRATNVATGAAAQTVTIGSTNSTSSLTLQAGSGEIDVTTTGLLDLNSATYTLNTSSTAIVTIGSTYDLDVVGALSINSSAGVINVGNDDDDFAINIGTQGERAISIGSGAFAQTITLGNNTGATSLALETGSGGLNIDADGNSAWDVSGTLDLQTGGALTIDSDAAITIGGDADAQAINIGTGAAARTITAGNATGATSIVLNCGTGNLDVGVNAVAHEVRIGSAAGAAGVTINTGTGGIDVGTNAIAATVTLGNVTGATALDLNSGTGGVTIDTVATGSIRLTAVDDAGSDISFQAHGSAVIEFNDATHNDLDSGFVGVTSIVGALNYIMTEGGTGTHLENDYKNTTGGAIDEGELVAIKLATTTLEILLCDATVYSANAANFLGVAEAQIANNGTGGVISEGPATVRFAAGEGAGGAGTHSGKEAFMSEATGLATLDGTSVSTSGAVLLPIGYVTDDSGYDNGVESTMEVHLVRGQKMIV